MSLWIDVDKVKEVLLSDGWHTVEKESFDTDSYELHHGEHVVVAGGSVPGVPHTGATWLELAQGYGGTTGDYYRRVWCPLTAILGLRSVVIAPQGSGGPRPRIKPVGWLVDDSLGDEAVDETTEGGGGAIEE